ncbi:hypothetical protein COM83_32675 [Bacillus cereus]|nr:hypothetical protein COM83_32675 [Bacillus cereus]PEA24025.1 hypothetical protein CON44_28060 [Bacillus cereus]PEQ28356.1 hypothetical protein CN467_29510 [Bacillus cereus]PER20830.1 hypothetical protein CN485_26240 [Bacillus cereus]PEW93085.1 hypothetical protein CN446_23715 [Bacillus cereus]
MIFYNDIWNALYVKGFKLFFFFWGIRGTPEEKNIFFDANLWCKQEHESSISNSFFDIIDVKQEIDRKILLVIYT